MNKELKFPADEIYDYIKLFERHVVDTQQILSAFSSLSNETIFDCLKELEDDNYIGRVVTDKNTYKFIII